MSSFRSLSNHTLGPPPRLEKYSLKGSQKRRLQSNLDSYTSFRKIGKDHKFLENTANINDGRQLKDNSAIASTLTDDHSVNCMQNLHSTLQFNRAASFDAFHFSKQIRLKRIPNHKASESTSYQKQDHQIQRESSDFSKEKDNLLLRSFQKNDQSKKSSHSKTSSIMSTHRKYNLIQNQKKDKNKFSLKKVGQIIPKRSQFRVCLRFFDLWQPLKMVSNEELTEMLEFKRNIQQKQTYSKFYQFLCNNSSTFSTLGCNCKPKCFWVNKWLNQAKYQEIKPSNHLANIQNFQKNITQIEKDIPRTQSHTNTFKDQSHLGRLRNILVEYVKIDAQSGYVQGMNILASVLVYHCSDEYESLKVLQLLMRQRNLRKVYQSDLTFTYKLGAVLERQLRRWAFDLYSHFCEVNLDIKMMVVGWYLSFLGTFVPLQWMHVVIEKYMRRGWSGINQIILSLLLYFKNQLMQKDEQQSIQSLSSTYLFKRAQSVNWLQIFTKSDNILLPQFQE